MWSDSESRIDYLNYSEVSEMIAEILSDDSMLPTSIGVYGSWGVGKSSILRLISQELSDDRYVVVDFDAWLYQDFDEAKSALMTVIAKSLYAAAPKDKKRPLRNTTDYRQHAGICHAFAPDRSPG